MEFVSVEVTFSAADGTLVASRCVDCTLVAFVASRCVDCTLVTSRCVECTLVVFVASRCVDCTLVDVEVVSRSVEDTWLHPVVLIVHWLLLRLHPVLLLLRIHLPSKWNVNLSLLFILNTS